MDRFILKSKIHRATLTSTALDYEGSITIDENLLEKAEVKSSMSVSAARARICKSCFRVLRLEKAARAIEPVQPVRVGFLRKDML